MYLWFLARELARLGHRVDVLVGPPYPDPMPFANSVTSMPNEQFWGKWFLAQRRHLIPQPRPLRVFEPLNFYELAASYLGFLPEPLAFSVRAFREVAARLRAGTRYDIIHDVQCLGYGILGIRKLGIPVVTTVHHPLTVDRRASFERDENLREAIGTMTFYPVGMQGFVARRLDGLFTSSTVSAREIHRDFGISTKRIRMVANGVDTQLFRPAPGAKRNANEILCVGRASDPNKGIGNLIESLALLPDHLRLTLVDNDHPKSPAREKSEKAWLREPPSHHGSNRQRRTRPALPGCLTRGRAFSLRGVRAAGRRGDGVRNPSDRLRGGCLDGSGRSGGRRRARAAGPTPRTRIRDRRSDGAT